MKIIRLLLVSVVGLWSSVATADFDASVAAFQKKDFQQAFAACYDDAKRGELRCQSQIAFLYENGNGLKQDYSEALKWHRLAAEQGNIYSQSELGRMYLNGIGTEKNESEALKWFKLAAEKGYVSAQNGAGLIYVLRKDYSEALKSFRLAANQGDPVAQSNLGDLYFQGWGVEKDLVEAIKWYQLSANQGNPVGQNSLGNAYFGGDGVEKNYEEAVKWYQLAAAQGNVFAESNLGAAYASGLGVLKDYPQAAKWHRLAADERNIVSQNALAVLYRNGWGVEKSSIEELKWRLRAANGNNGLSQLVLAFAYRDGDEVTKDDVEALKWAAIANRFGAGLTEEQKESAKNLQRSLEAKLSPNDVLRARRFADGWTATSSSQDQRLASNNPSSTGSTKSLEVAPKQASTAAESADGNTAKTQGQTAGIKAFALVIGNSAYRGATLTNPRNDAQAIAKQLASFGITVDLVIDATRKKFVEALTKFADRAAGADVILLYYAGHGVQYNGVNYLVPVDVDLTADASASAFTLDAISLSQLLEQYLPAKTRIVFLDACRDNPMSRSLARTRGAGTRGLAPVSVASGTLISFATKDGSVAMDGSGRNSPFAEALLAHLGDPADISIILRRVRSQVLNATGNKQEPWEYGSLVGDELVLSTMLKNRQLRK